MTRYFSVLVPYSKTPTVWHPTTPVGPFSVLSRGNFPTEDAAHSWAKDHLEGQPYEVKPYDDEARFAVTGCDSLSTFDQMFTSNKDDETVLAWLKTAEVGDIFDEFHSEKILRVL